MCACLRACMSACMRMCGRPTALLASKLQTGMRCAPCGLRQGRHANPLLPILPLDTGGVHYVLGCPSAAITVLKVPAACVCNCVCDCVCLCVFACVDMCVCAHTCKRYARHIDHVQSCLSRKRARTPSRPFPPSSQTQCSFEGRSW